MADIKVPIAKPIIGEEEIKNVVEVLKSGMIAQGPKVAEFEEKFAAWIGTKYAIATNSGTSALHVALLAAGIGKGDEVITTPFTFIATGNSIVYTGATPVFADIAATNSALFIVNYLLYIFVIIICTYIAVFKQYLYFSVYLFSKIL